MRRVVFLTAAFVLLVLLVGLAFAGSRTTLATGTQVAGVDVGGLTEAAATQLLLQRAAAVERTPITFTASGQQFVLSASQLGVGVDWAAGARAAAAEGAGFGPLRGFRRLRARLFGITVTPRPRAYKAAVAYKLDQIAGRVDRSGVDAKLVRRGLTVSTIPGRSGRKLDRRAATKVIVRSLAALDRPGPIALPVAAAAPRVTPADLAASAARARMALSAPIRLTYGATRYRVPRWRIAPLLSLSSGGSTKVTIAGRQAEQYLEQLSETVSRAPRDARFQITATGKIIIRPSASGLLLDLPATASAISAAAFSPDRRTAALVVRVAQPPRTTDVAKTMGITGVVSSYTTTYGGTPGRLNNVQLVARLIDGALIKPGGTFSFNGTTGERTAAKGFQEAPVIINGELKDGLGGGICQVSTTVFNAAFDAGLPINERFNHGLYISHYPLGRDATVNYPDLDLRFTNDTERWLLLRTFVSAGSLTVNLYGTPLTRRVESTAAPLTVTGPIPVKEVDDPALAKGKRVIDEVGSPPRATSVERKVYAANGTLLYDDTWHSSYDGEPSLVRVGTKKPAEPKSGKQGQPAAKGVVPATGPTATSPEAGATPAVSPLARR